jgi:LysR family transcriptional regulator of gallate degradation
MSIGLRHLRVFLAVVEHGSATRASASLFRAQSAITRSIHTLESELGVPLFERRSKGMLMTRYGEALLRRARRASDELDQARRELARLPGSAARIRGAPVFSMQVSEQRLRAFVALTELQHMPTVANQFGITQPAVSAAVRELEASLGLLLFERTPKGMLPSVHGEVLALHVKRSLAELRHARDEIASLRGSTQGAITVGALPLGRTLILPRAIARVVSRHPGLRIATVEGPFATLVAALRSGDVDFILGALRPPGYAIDLVGEPLLSEELAIVARADHPLFLKPRTTLQAVARGAWVLPRPGTPTRDLVEALFAKRGISTPDVRVETSDLAVLRGVLLESDLVTAISARQLDHEFRAGLLKAVPIALPETSRRIGITLRSASVPSPGTALLMDEIRAIAADLDR